jgi:hypothetical protein
MKRKCPKCYKEHDIAYVYHANMTKHLILLHKYIKKNGKEKRSDIYLPYEDHLDIPIVFTKNQEKKEKATAPKEAEVAGQISLLT